jgi:hypothetical protein
MLRVDEFYVKKYSSYEDHKSGDLDPTVLNYDEEYKVKYNKEGQIINTFVRAPTPICHCECHSCRCSCHRPHASKEYPIKFANFEYNIKMNKEDVDEYPFFINLNMSNETIHHINFIHCQMPTMFNIHNRHLSDNHIIPEQVTHCIGMENHCIIYNISDPSLPYGYFELIFNRGIEHIQRMNKYSKIIFPPGMNENTVWCSKDLVTTSSKWDDKDEIFVSDLTNKIIIIENDSEVIELFDLWDQIKKEFTEISEYHPLIAKMSQSEIIKRIYDISNKNLSEFSHFLKYYNTCEVCAYIPKGEITDKIIQIIQREYNLMKNIKYDGSKYMNLTKINYDNFMFNRHHFLKEKNVDHHQSYEGKFPFIRLCYNFEQIQKDDIIYIAYYRDDQNQEQVIINFDFNELLKVIRSDFPEYKITSYETNRYFGKSIVFFE